MRWLASLLLSLVAGAASQVACGTSAVGVEDCRSIERARCQAARPCEFGIDSNADEAVCLRFARDNCLHGMLVQAPTAGSVTKCVNAITGAGTCAAKKTTLGSDCAAVAPITSTSVTVCELIENPEQIPACEFLTDQPKPEPTATPPPKDSGAD